MRTRSGGSRLLGNYVVADILLQRPDGELLLFGLPDPLERLDERPRLEGLGRVSRLGYHHSDSGGVDPLYLLAP